MTSKQPPVEMDIARGFSLDADYLAGRSTALLGKKGSGKSHGMRVLAEEYHKAGVQQVIFDPMGVFWGLRSSADGLSEGLSIPVFSGAHGDAPLEHTAGELMADIAVNEGLSMILDLSDFTSRSQERQFALALLDRLYRFNKARNLIHVSVDEADLFAPQKPRPQDAPLLAVMENLVRRGRNVGIGSTLATQRPAVVSKDVLTQVDALVALRMTGPQNREAIKSWVSGQGDAESWVKVAPSLPGLANGEAWWWVPEKGVLERVQIRNTTTFDSSPTRSRASGTRTPKKIADVDLGAISAQIAATVERAQANDPKALKKQIAQLERDLHKATTAAPAVEPVRIEVPTPFVPPGLLDALTEAMVSLQRATEMLASIEAPKKPIEGPLSPVARPKGLDAPPSRPRPTPAALHGVQSSTDEQVPPARLRLLNALYGLLQIGIDQPSRTQLALWSQVSPKSSGYTNNLGALRSAGLIDYPRGGAVCLTDAGQALVDVSAAADLPDDEALHEHVRSLVSPARWRLLSVLIEHYPDALSKADLAEQAQVSAASSGYTNNLGALRSLGLVEYPSPGAVVATSVLFLSEGRS